MLPQTIELRNFIQKHKVKEIVLREVFKEREYVLAEFDRIVETYGESYNFTQVSKQNPTDAVIIEIGHRSNEVSEKFRTDVLEVANKMITELYQQ